MSLPEGLRNPRASTAAMVRFCFTSATSLVGGVSEDIISVNNIKIARPDLYNDGHLVVHSMEGPGTGGSAPARIVLQRRQAAC